MFCCKCVCNLVMCLFITGMSGAAEVRGLRGVHTLLRPVRRNEILRVSSSLSILSPPLVYTSPVFFMPAFFFYLFLILSTSPLLLTVFPFFYILFPSFFFSTEWKFYKTFCFICVTCNVQFLFFQIRWNRNYAVKFSKKT